MDENSVLTVCAASNHLLVGGQQWGLTNSYRMAGGRTQNRPKQEGAVQRRGEELVWEYASEICERIVKSLNIR